jgi:hypothetical protein
MVRSILTKAFFLRRKDDVSNVSGTSGYPYAKS